MRTSVHLRDCPAAARVVAVARRLTAVIASDDDAPRKEEEEGGGDDSRRGSVEDERTATAMTLGILVCLLCGCCYLSEYQWCWGLLGVVVRSSDGL